MDLWSEPRKYRPEWSAILDRASEILLEERKELPRVSKNVAGLKTGGVSETVVAFVLNLQRCDHISVFKPTIKSIYYLIPVLFQEINC